VKEELVYLGVDIAKSHLDAAIGAQNIVSVTTPSAIDS
jgi:hypothetical protein